MYATPPSLKAYICEYKNVRTTKNPNLFVTHICENLSNNILKNLDKVEEKQIQECGARKKNKKKNSPTHYVNKLTYTTTKMLPTIC